MVILTKLVRNALKKQKKAPYGAVIEFTMPNDGTQQYFAMTDLSVPPESVTSLMVADTHYLRLENYQGKYYAADADADGIKIALDGKHLVFFEKPRRADYENVLPRAIIFQDGRLFVNERYKRDREFLVTFAPDLAEMEWVFKEKEYWNLFDKDSTQNTSIEPRPAD
jgi:hypothetical protein